MNDEPHTLGAWVRPWSGTDRVAIEDQGVTLTYADLEARAGRLAGRLREAGYVPGDRVCTVTATGSDQVVLFLACARAGLVLAPLSWRLTSEELLDHLLVCDPSLVLVERDRSGVMAGVVEAADRRGGAQTLQVRDLPVGVLGADGVEADPPGRRFRPGAPEPGPGTRSVRDEDPLLMIFTSGSSGRPKAAVLSHAACFWTNHALGRVLPLRDDDVVLSVLPQFHVGAWNIQPLLAWSVGARVVLESGFDPGRVLHLIARHRVSALMAVPTQYLLLAEHPDFEATDLSSVRTAVVGGAPMPPALLRRFHRRGVPLTQGYGLTEAGPNVLCLRPASAEDPGKVGSAGRPYPGVEVRVVDPASGQVLAGGGVRGELLVRGPSLFSGYFRDPEATAAVLRGGWLHTGDVVERDEDGDLRVVDRLGNLYISGGENVSPAEVEAVLAAHPGVEEVAVVGVPDERWGEVGHALVVRRRGRAVDEDELLEHARTRLAGFKVPARVSFVRELPRAGLGKRDARAVRALVGGPS